MKMMDCLLFLVLFLCGCSIVGDGLGSMAEYLGQKPIERLVRLIRAGMGCLIVYISLLLYSPILVPLMIPAIAISAVAGWLLGRSYAHMVNLRSKKGRT
jgi:hypothetical protein